jgi:hypothetical protein
LESYDGHNGLPAEVINDRHHRPSPNVIKTVASLPPAPWEEPERSRRRLLQPVHRAVDGPLHDGPPGDRAQRPEGGHGHTEQEARAKLIEALAARQAGSLLVRRGRELTVGQYAEH